MLYRCYAKLNLTLEILRRRTDGFHELRSLVHTINVSDDLRIEPADTLITRVEGLDVADEDNLIVRAAQLLARATRARAGAELTLVKGIPAAAGLGGGSSDAAATLLGLNSLWRTGFGYTDLLALAAQLGSDVPYFVRGGAALMCGRGDQLKPVPALERQWVVVVVPRHQLLDKTARLYAALLPSDFTSGELTERAASSLERHAPLRDDDFLNIFERAARTMFDGLDELWRLLEAKAGRRFHLSGAGPALFALATDLTDAERVAQQVDDMRAARFVARTVKHARAVARPRFTRVPRIGYR
jgi:4-diphosphocytidyl-2-C-methyl-D-erythritol kinase